MSYLEAGTDRSGLDGVAGDDRTGQRQGRDLLFALHSAMRALKLYPLENQTVQKALTELHGLAGTMGAVEGGLLLRYVGDFCFINDLRLRVDLASYATFGAIGRTLRGHEIGHLEADAESTREEWTVVLSLLLQEPDIAEPFGKFRDRKSTRLNSSH